MNLHYSLSLDLFGGEVSTNAANAFNSGIKGRYREAKLDGDHRLTDATYKVSSVVDAKIVTEDAPALTAINMRLRDDYVHDASGGVGRWNKIIEKAGVPFKLSLPHEGFHRQIGVFSSVSVTPEGEIIGKDTWEAQLGDWLPTKADGDFIQSLMVPCYTNPASSPDGSIRRRSASTTNPAISICATPHGIGASERLQAIASYG